MQASVKLKYSLKVHHSVKETKRMPAIEIGRICMKQKGRETGKRCVIIDVMDKSFVFVTGPQKVTGVKRRRANVAHLQPLEAKIDISRGASDEEVSSALESAAKVGAKTRTKK
jgi:large subunit ribosomal protein L14e